MTNSWALGSDMLILKTPFLDILDAYSSLLRFLAIMNVAPSSYGRSALPYAPALVTTRTKPQSTKQPSQCDPKKKAFLDIPLGECDGKELPLPDALQGVYYLSLTFVFDSTTTFSYTDSLD